MLDYAIKYGEKKGVEVEAYMLNVRKIQIGIEKNSIKKVREVEDYGIGIRVICDGAIGFSYTSNPSEKKIEECVEHAIKLAEIQTGNFESFPKVGSSGTYPSYDPKVNNLTEDSLVEMAEDLLEGVQEKSKEAIVNADIECVISARKIANPTGEVGDKISYISVSAFTVVPSDIPSTGFDMALDSHLDRVNTYEVGKNSVEMAINGLNPTKLESKPDRVILAPLASAEILGVLVYYLSGISLKRKRSPLYGKINEKIFDEKFTLYYDNNNPLGRGFDDEGVPTKPTVFIKNGVVNSYALDMVSAKNLKHEESRGFAYRSGFRNNPEAYPHTISVKEEDSIQLEDIKNGIIVNYLSGMHTLNFETADFSVGTMGPIFLVKNGEILKPVKSVMLSGNLIEMLKKVDLIGKYKFIPLFPILLSTVGFVPHLVVDNISVVS